MNLVTESDAALLFAVDTGDETDLVARQTGLSVAGEVTNEVTNMDTIFVVQTFDQDIQPIAASKNAATAGLRKEALKLPHPMQADATWLADQVDRAAVRSHPRISCTWSDDGELFVEWLFERRRIAFSFDPHEGSASWFYVDLRAGRRTQQSGELRSVPLLALHKLATTN